MRAINILGLMSGTSLDGIDIALVQFSEKMEVKYSKTYALPITIRNRVLEILRKGPKSWKEIGMLDVQLGEIFAKTCFDFASEFGFSLTQIDAIGSPGQTIWHEPGVFTLQLGDANIIRERTGCKVITDFRRADVAQGGQGAPFAPILHKQILPKRNCMVNIGGIANITITEPFVYGFDTGPGNALIDSYTYAQWGELFDKDAAHALKGQVIHPLLVGLLEDPYFHKKGPKSTGREYFDLQWLQGFDLKHKPEDIVATLVELTARTIIHAKPAHAPLWVTGGGVHNPLLMMRLKALSDAPVNSIGMLGYSPDHLEAVLFAYLAYERLLGRSTDTRSITGAKKAVLLGAIY